MPVYEYSCSNCDYIFDKLCKIADRDEPCKDSCIKCGGEIKRVIITAPSIGDVVSLGIKQPDDTWKEYIKNVDKKNPGNKIKNIW